MSDFTEGPLFIQGPSQGGTECDDGGDYAIVDSRHEIIGEAIHKIGHFAFRPAEANAALWANSPYMHDLLSRIVDWDDQLGEGQDPETSEMALYPKDENIDILNEVREFILRRSINSRYIHRE